MTSIGPFQPHRAGVRQPAEHRFAVGRVVPAIPARSSWVIGDARAADR